MSSGPPLPDPLPPLDRQNLNNPIETQGTSRHEEAQNVLAMLTDEERMIMKECERDSFYKRALPASVGAMSAAFMMVKSGRWAAHPKYGPIPKVIIAGFVGHFIGKVMYLPVCQQKILTKLPNSNLAAAIRKSKGLPDPEQQVDTWEEGAGRSNRHSKLEEYKPVDGLDDRFRPSVDRDVKEPAVSPQEKNTITYDELRRRNRQEHEDYKKQQVPPPGSQKTWPDSGDRAQPDNRETDIRMEPPPYQAPPKRKRTNMWGDPIEE
ncbi:OCIA domain-containing protein 1-like isoform X1 [Physella acuta]|uniref:OCIA domain-containing protein 1-like isoform X1 n=2 Tax=Physella acuta TaxID=109671 RepID=UPI0027DE6F6D|nr:OCIA domain-containing protein 1-like isoform X1 [Physella acuta]